MTSTIRLARVRGIDIGAHWSWLLVVALIVWSLADAVFPATNPGLSDGAYLAMAIVASVLFFASIVLHELGHAIQAQREGMPIGGITLWVFGGVATLRGAPPSAGAELRVALAGPAVSLALGVVFLALALAVPLPSGVDGLAFWLGQMNLYLLVFNLLPALPLDGGRVFRALLWARRRDFASATRTAGRVGQGFGQLLIAGGLALVIFVGDFGGLWLAFVGWFVLVAAQGEMEHARGRTALEGLTVADAMIRSPVTVTPHATVERFMADVFLPTRHTAFPVTTSGEALGIVSYRGALDLAREAWATTPVREVMVEGRHLCVAADTPLAEAVPTLERAELGRLLVCRDGRLEGMLSLTDVARAMVVCAGGRREPRFARPAATTPSPDGRRDRVVGSP